LFLLNIARSRVVEVIVLPVHNREIAIRGLLIQHHVAAIAIHIGELAGEIDGETCRVADGA
jgi:hypothetical protein